MRRVPHTPSPQDFVEHFARFGFAVKGVVYLIIGALAALAPVGMGTHPTGTHGALHALMRQPVGSLLLGVVAFGLLCFGLFQLLRAVRDPEREGSDAKGIARRVGWAWNALIHFGLVVVAVGMI